ncbi:GDP-mannose 4,6-dehydratase [Pelagibacterales bacterium SAG-MED47]|nr:GDP-mannose 4,6-dehydratase [Pelagibacterales bacterium SAG-MED47]
MKFKKAIITGVTGQDGSYLAEFLLKKNYIVHGIKRKSSSFNTSRIDHIYENKHLRNKFFLHYGDLLDSNTLTKIIKEVKPDEIYNFAAQSHVGVSFDLPNYTSQVNSIGTLNLLQAIKDCGLEKKTKFYQASTSELFGEIQEKKQSEKTKFYPKSPYATSKLFAYWITKNFRESYNIFASNGILFNHESPRRGETFVTRKITIGLSKIIYGLEKSIYLGNIYSLRDWGHAKDYVQMCWKVLQYKKPDDFVIATEKQYSVKFFIENCFKYLGIKIKWFGKGINEFAKIIKFDDKKYPKLKKGMIVVKINKKYFRPNEVDNLVGNATKAKKLLKWKPKINIYQLIKEMIDADLEIVRKSTLI